MFVFQLRVERGREGLKHIPRKVLSKAEVRKIVGLRCPETVVKEIVQRKLGKKEVERICISIRKIVNGKISDMFGHFNKDVAALFVNNPNGFINIANVVGDWENASPAIGLLMHKDLGNIFARDPNKIIRSFEKLAKVTGKKYPTYGFIALENKNIRAQFISRPDQLIRNYDKFVNSVRTEYNRAYLLLGNKDIGALFAKNPDRVIRSFEKLTKATGAYADSLFGLLLRENDIAALFARNPDGFVKIAERIGKVPGSSGEDIVQAIYALKNKDMGAYFIQNTNKLAIYFGRIANITGTAVLHEFSELYEKKNAKLFVKDPDKYIKTLRR
jgi:hypothetical protein